MSNQTALVKRYMAYRLSGWKAGKNDSRLKADMANLRRGIGRAPGDMPELWGLLFEGFPQELMSTTGTPTCAEWAVSTALSMFALHQQGKSITEQCMDQPDASLGRAVCRLVKSQDDMARIQRRFNAFATAEDMGECAHHLRGLVQLLRSEGIPLDYPALAADLLEFQWCEGAQRVRLRWGQDFYRNIDRDEEGKDDSDE